MFPVYAGVTRFAELLKSLIEAATENGVTFCYALSPGLDIVYSSQKEVNSIKQKFQQVGNVFCYSVIAYFDVFLIEDLGVAKKYITINLSFLQSLFTYSCYFLKHLFPVKRTLNK